MGHTVLPTSLYFSAFRSGNNDKSTGFAQKKKDYKRPIMFRSSLRSALAASGEEIVAVSSWGIFGALENIDYRFAHLQSVYVKFTLNSNVAVLLALTI